jgi:hypothetical protein
MINLWINWFDCSDPERAKEYEYCLRKNLENPLIGSIRKMETEGRITYNRFFAYMDQHPEDVNIISNLDIYFDETIRYAETIQGRNVYSITRWEEMPDGSVISFQERNPGVHSKFSQDAWIFRGSPTVRNAEFALGIPGCDNKISYLLWAAGYNVTNPCYSIKAIHKHEKEWRDTSRDAFRIEHPFYFPEPCHL